MKKLYAQFFSSICVALAALMLFSCATTQGDPGIYVGIMSFSDRAAVLTQTENADNITGNFIVLDSAEAEAELKQIISEKYAPSDNFGTALFYTVHKAVADIAAAEKKGLLPKNIDAVYLITVTDGYDTASAAPELGKEIKEFPKGLRISQKKRLHDAGYSSFIEKALRKTTVTQTITFRNVTRKSKRPIYSYSLGFGDALPNQLKSIGSNPDNKYAFQGDLPNLRSRLSEITRQIGTENEQMLLTAVFSPPFSGTRLRFEIDKENYIEATVVNKSGVYDVVDVRSVPEDLYEARSGHVVREGAQGSGSFSVEFIINKIFPNETEGKLYRLNVDRGTPLLDSESQVIIHDGDIPNRKSAIVYFLLDNSRSMEGEIDQIPDSLMESLSYLKERYTGSGLNSPVSPPAGQDSPTVPSTPPLPSLSPPPLPSPLSPSPTSPPPPPRTIAPPNNAPPVGAALPSAGNYLNPLDSIREWQAFIAEDSRQNPSRNNLLFFQLDVATIHASVPRDSNGNSLQYSFDVPGDINTIRQYWVQVGSFQENQKTMANDLLVTLKKYFPAVVIADREGFSGTSTFRIGPFQNARDAAEFSQGISNSRGIR